MAEEDDEIVIAEEEEETVTAEEEEVEVTDPHETLRDECRREKCADLVDKLDTCNRRVNSKTKTREICLEEICDLFECVESCVAKDLFKILK